MQAFYFDTVESTNDLARTMVTEGKIRDLAYIVARQQTAGRGNRGRTWASPLDAGIYLTVIDRPAARVGADLHNFTRAAAIACVETLQKLAGVNLRIKPINDLYFDGRKLGGILTEAVIEQQQLRALITGIGINVASADRTVPAGHIRPVCLQEIMPPNEFKSLDPGELTLELVQRVRHWNAVVSSGNLGTLEEQWEHLRIDPSVPPEFVDNLAI